jgi:hypothetical protein
VVSCCLTNTVQILVVDRNHFRTFGSKLSVATSCLVFMDRNLLFLHLDSRMLQRLIISTILSLLLSATAVGPSPRLHVPTCCRYVLPSQSRPALRSLTVDLTSSSFHSSEHHKEHFRVHIRVGHTDRETAPCYGRSG